MGLLTGLLGLGLPRGPIRAATAAAQQVQRQAEEVYYDPATIRAELEDVDRLREAGELSEEEAAAWEEQLVERMMEGRRRRAGR